MGLTLPKSTSATPAPSLPGSHATTNASEHDGHFMACFLPFFNLCDVVVGAVERHIGSGFLGDDFVVEIVTAVVAEPFGIRNFTDNIDDCLCFFGGGGACAICNFVKASLNRCCAGDVFHGALPTLCPCAAL